MYYSGASTCAGEHLRTGFLGLQLMHQDITLLNCAVSAAVLVYCQSLPTLAKFYPAPVG
jgi:hypothetical protein